MKNFNRLNKRWIEAIIVVLLISILLTLFIPKFQDAQITAKIAQAKRDLNNIIQTADILQQELKEEELYLVRFYNDKLGNTRQKALFYLLNQNHISRETHEFQPLFLELLDALPVQQLPLDFDQDWHDFPWLENGKQVMYHQYGFQYEKLRFDTYHQLTIRKEPYEFYISPGFGKSSPDDIREILSTYTLPVIQYPPDVNTYRSMAHTAGPVLIRKLQPIPVYDPSNGLLSHGILFQFTTTDEKE